MKGSMKRFFKVNGKILLVIVVLILVLVGFAMLNINIPSGDAFELNHVVSMEASEYSKNGSDWGHNQNKLASIGDVIFTFNFDNSNFENGNSSVDNPYYCEFVYVNEYEQTKFDEQTCNRPGNVLSDEERNKVYYILSVPTGPANEGGEDYSGVARTVMFEYDFDPILLELVLYEVHDVTNDASDGKIRQGVDIDEVGNLIIAYGRYDSWMNVFTFDVENRVWQQYEIQTNNEGHSLMYSIPTMKDLEHFYVLSVQDVCNDDGCFYQYVKFFAYESGVWRDEMIVDYRDTELAETEEKIVLNSDCYYYDWQVHILTTAYKLSEVKYYIYEDGVFTERDTSFLSSGTSNLKFIEYNDTLMLTAIRIKLHLFAPRFEVYSLDSLERVFSISFVINNRYFYVNGLENGMQLLMYSNKKGSL